MRIKVKTFLFNHLSVMCFCEKYVLAIVGNLAINIGEHIPSIFLNEKILISWKKIQGEATQNFFWKNLVKKDLKMYTMIYFKCIQINFLVQNYKFYNKALLWNPIWVTFWSSMFIRAVCSKPISNKSSVFGNTCLKIINKEKRWLELLEHMICMWEPWAPTLCCLWALHPSKNLWIT